MGVKLCESASVCTHSLPDGVFKNTVSRFMVGNSRLL